MNKAYRRIRAIRPTVLIVGEGVAEHCFLSSIRAMYTSAGNGCSLSIDNAHGKGALNVIKQAAAKKLRTGYDEYAAFFDTDTGWNEQAKAFARSKGVVLLPNSPCLEALVLEIYDIRVEGDQRINKDRFMREFGCEAHEDNLMSRILSKDHLDEARNRVKNLDDLLKLIRV